MPATSAQLDAYTRDALDEAFILLGALGSGPPTAAGLVRAGAAAAGLRRAAGDLAEADGSALGFHHDLALEPDEPPALLVRLALLDVLAALWARDYGAAGHALTVVDHALGELEREARAAAAPVARPPAG